MKRPRDVADGPAVAAEVPTICLHSRPRRPAGFSLVELVIVVVNIGMLAAIAVPRFSRGSSEATAAALRADLATVRRALDRYAAEHQGNYPDGSDAEIKERLTKYTDVHGDIADAPSATHRFGPYLRSVPTLRAGQNKGSAGFMIDRANSPPVAVVGSDKGWAYNPDTGELGANVAAAVKVELKLTD